MDNLTLAVAAAFSAFTLQAEPGERADDTPVQALLSCAEIEAEAARLACQDAALADLAAALEAGDIRVVREDRSQGGVLAGLGGLFNREGSGDEADAESQAREETLEDGAVAVYDPDGEIDEVRGLGVSRVTANRFDRLTVYLENGQVWRQTSNERVPAPDDDEIDSLTAEIDSGLFGSYFMELSHNNRRFRAERVR